MSITIEGVPESITRERLVELLKTLGIDVSLVTRGGIHVDRDHIRCEVFAFDENGNRYADAHHNVVTHSIAIPIVDEP